MADRVWINDGGLALSADNLNGMETDIKTALGVPDAALAARVLAGNTKTALDAAYVNESDNATALAGKVSKGEIVLNLGDSTAVLNGTTDDTAAIQAFVTAAPTGATIIMPAGKSAKVTDKINLTKAVTIPEWKMTLGTNNKAFNITANDVTVRDCKLTGVGIGAGYVANNRAIAAYSIIGTPLTNLNIVRNRITGINDTCIHLEYVSNSLVQGNYCKTYNYAGIMLISGTDVDILGNTTDGAVHNGNINSYGIAASDLANTIAARSTRVKIHGNTILNVPDWEGIDTHGGSFISIVGNTITGARRAIQCLVGNEPTRVTAPQNCLIVGNTIDGTGAVGATTGITLYGKTDSSMLAHGVIVGNAIYNCTTPVQTGFTDPLLTVVHGNVGQDSDTGWLALSGYFTGWASNSTYPARYRVIKRGTLTTVYLEGALSRTTGTANLITLPTAAQPGYAKIVGVTNTVTNTPQTGTLEITAAGVLRFVFTAATTDNISIAATYSF